MYVIKKDGTLEKFNKNKIINAVTKSANRVMIILSQEDKDFICNKVMELINENHWKDIDITNMHNVVETALEEFNPKVAKSYRDYRNYKKDFVHMMDKVYEKSQMIRYIGDRNNANTDSALVPTQRSLIYNELNSELYKKFFLSIEEKQAMKDGYIYIHDRSARLDAINCCLFNISDVITGGFEMGNVWYNEPKTLDVAFDVISDIVMSAAACQYGGFTIPRVDSILVPFAQKSYHKYYEEYIDNAETIITNIYEIVDNKHHDNIDKKYANDTVYLMHEKANDYAMKKVRRDMEQGFQSWEYRFNTVGSSRGDYPFIAASFGIDTTPLGLMATEVILEVRKGGQGKAGFKKPVLFPKLTFLYDENLHGKGKPFEYIFDKALECSSKCMYPDFLSLTGEGYIPSMYKKYGKVVSLMGCLHHDEQISIDTGTFKIGDIIEAIKVLADNGHKIEEFKKSSKETIRL